MSKLVTIDIVVLEGGRVPQRMTPGSAGYDCYARTSGYLYVGETQRVPLGFSIAMPNWIVGTVRGRSSLCAQGVLAHIGTIDSDYRGEVCVVLHCLGPKSFYWDIGDRICQVLFENVLETSLITTDTLPPTQRGGQGFGSTGRQ